MTFWHQVPARFASQIQEKSTLGPKVCNWWVQGSTNLKTAPNRTPNRDPKSIKNHQKSTSGPQGGLLGDSRHP